MKSLWHMKGYCFLKVKNEAFKYILSQYHKHQCRKSKLNSQHSWISDTCYPMRPQDSDTVYVVCSECYLFRPPCPFKHTPSFQTLWKQANPGYIKTLHTYCMVYHDHIQSQMIPDAFVWWWPMLCLINTGRFPIKTTLHISHGWLTPWTPAMNY